MNDQAVADATQPAVSMAHQPYIAAALASDEVNTSAVEAARKALESGELDTPQAISRLADRLVRFGL